MKCSSFVIAVQYIHTYIHVGLHVYYIEKARDGREGEREGEGGR